MFDLYSEMTVEEKIDQVFKATVMTALRVNSHDERLEFHEEIHTGHFVRFAEQTMTNEEHELQMNQIKETHKKEFENLKKDFDLKIATERKERLDAFEKQKKAQDEKDHKQLVYMTNTLRQMHIDKYDSFAKSNQAAKTTMNATTLGAAALAGAGLGGIAFPPLLVAIPISGAVGVVGTALYKSNTIRPTEKTFIGKIYKEHPNLKDEAEVRRLAKCEYDWWMKAHGLN